MTNQQILPGACIGIIGGGQLGKMTAMAAARMGYRTVVWTPLGDVPATYVATHSILKPYDNEEALKEFVRLADVATIEFENIPLDLLNKISDAGIPTRPSSKVLEITQDRWHEKTLFSQLDIPTAPTVNIESADQLTLPILGQVVYPAILKTRRLGYDGKGQVSVESAGDLPQAWEKLGGVPCVLEGRVKFLFEGSVIVARNPNREIKTYPVFKNFHEGGILRHSHWPIGKSLAMLDKVARQIARDIAKKLDLEGLLAVEMFFTAEQEIYANELAPRPHNSGHGTIEACSVSQFEQHVRAICNLSLGSTEPHSEFVMKNLIGDEVEAWGNYLHHLNSTVHLYGKKETKPGRKMGHVTTLSRL